MNHSIATALTNPGAPMKVRGVQKRFGAFTALDNVSLDVAAGELACLLGPSGCGKTTLLRCIAGLEKQDSGELYLGDRDVSHLAPQARDYGILFQSTRCFPTLPSKRTLPTASPAVVAMKCANVSARCWNWSA